MKQMISELAVQYFWFQNGGQQGWVATDGSEIKILHPGKWNMYDGPDFYQAQWKRHGVLSNGVVEIHVQSSDWQRHGHERHPLYQGVDLHVVAEDDAMQNYAAHTISLSQNGISLPQIISSIQMADVRDKEIFEWKRRVSRYRSWVLEYGEPMASWIALSRAMGCHIHGDEMEHLAKHIPWQHSELLEGSLQFITAYFLRRAGFLNEVNAVDAYAQSLLTLSESVQSLSIFWKRKCRPHNRAVLRVVQLASLYHRCSGLDISTIQWSILYEALMQLEISDYWKYHYGIGQSMKLVGVHLSSARAESIVINAFGHRSVDER